MKIVLVLDPVAQLICITVALMVAISPCIHMQPAHLQKTLQGLQAERYPWLASVVLGNLEANQ